MSKLWEKGYSLNKEIEEYTVDEDYLLDQELVPYDCKGSIAHAKMLGKIGILTKEEVKKLVKGLNEIIELHKKGKFIVKKEDEDCNTAIENYLVKKLGQIGKKIHTARSRNDQIATALRLYYKDKIKEIKEKIKALHKEMEKFKSKYQNVEMPGYTHMRKAMPSSVALWIEAYIESMEDNKIILEAVEELIDQSPLGTGAGYGVPLKIDRKFTAKELGFKKVQKNPIYVQHSRGKFESSILHSLSQIMYDLNKMSTDLILFSMSEFGYFELSLEICTGSSIMPQKKNPDVLEIMRAKYHQVVAYEFQVKNTIGNLISGYNRDVQLTKGPIMNGFEITEKSLNIMKIVLENTSVNKENCKKGMSKELYATKEVYELVKKGMSFRDAYKKIAEELK